MRSADYVEQTTTSIAGTSGDGAVTMTAITNVPTFSIVFGTQATTMRYVIEDTVNKKFETGVGSVASGVLTRTKPQITWDGTIWLANSPSALQFGAAPASGNVKIRMSATAESTANPMPQPQTLIAGDNWRDYPWSAAFSSLTGNGVQCALTANREYYAAYKLERAGALTGLQYEVSTGASGNIKSALYSCGADGLPGAKIVDFVPTSCTAAAIKTDTATGSWTPSTPPNLTPGWYYVGIISDVAPSIRGFSGNAISSPTPLGRRGPYGMGHLAYVTGSYVTGLPALPSLTGGGIVDPGANGVFWVGIKVTA